MSALLTPLPGVRCRYGELRSGTSRLWWVYRDSELAREADHHAESIARRLNRPPLVLPVSVVRGPAFANLVRPNGRASNPGLRAWLTLAWLAGTSLSDALYRFLPEADPGLRIVPFVHRRPALREVATLEDGTPVDVIQLPDTPLDTYRPVAKVLARLDRNKLIVRTARPEDPPSRAHNPVRSVNFQEGDPFYVADRDRHLYGSATQPNWSDQEVHEHGPVVQYLSRDPSDGGQPIKALEEPSLWRHDQIRSCRYHPNGQRRDALRPGVATVTVPEWIFTFNWVAIMSAPELSCFIKLLDGGLSVDEAVSMPSREDRDLTPSVLRKLEVLGLIEQKASKRGRGTSVRRGPRFGGLPLRR